MGWELSRANGGCSGQTLSCAGCDVTPPTPLPMVETIVGFEDERDAKLYGHFFPRARASSQSIIALSSARAGSVGESTAMVLASVLRIILEL